MFRRAAQLMDNAFFYKDLTQWLRSGAFVALFFALLLAGEAATAFTLCSNTGVKPGRQLLLLLDVALFLYLALVALRGFLATTRELRSSTVEFFVLTGLAPDRIVRSQWLAMLVQMLFGLAGMMPFLFIAYLVGGLDFFQVLGSVACIALWSSPVCLVALGVAYAIARRDTAYFIMQMVIVIWTGCFAGIPVLLIIGGVIAFLFRLSGVSFQGGIFATLIKGIFTLNLPLMIAGAVLAFLCWIANRLLLSFCIVTFGEAVPQLGVMFYSSVRRHATRVAATTAAGDTALTVPLERRPFSPTEGLR